MRGSIFNKVLLGLSFLVPALLAEPAMAQWGAYGSGGGGWGAYAYGVSSQASNVSRELAAGAHRKTFNRAQQQSAAMQQGIRNTLSSSAQSRAAGMQNYTQDYTNWTLQHRDRQRAESRLPTRSFASSPAMARPYSSASSAARVSTDIIKWPVPLMDPRFDKLRAEVEEPFRKQASAGSLPTIEDYQKMIEAADQMKQLLTGMAFQVSAAQYKELERFLDSLAGEARGRVEKRSGKQPKKETADKTPATS
jgi:hypothetical protein